MKVVTKYSKKVGGSIAHFTDPDTADETTTLCGLIIQNFPVTSAMQRDFPVCRTCEDQFRILAQR